jgi:uncharacterized protein (DUF952 family)
MIYHITTKSTFEEQINSEEISHPSLQLEGFIHCSFDHQIEPVLERYFQGVIDILILKIDSTKLKNELIIEASTNDELYPHVYGTINRDAIVDVKEL